VGFAGALDATLKVGEILEPRFVINAADGARTDTGAGNGTLVSFASVADPEQKRKLGLAYGALAVDMEAAAVAQGAQSRGIEFGAVKSISDAADFSLPPTEKFIASDGQFRAAAFAGHVALRPWFWAPTIALARNSKKARRSLCEALSVYLERQSATLNAG
jgi:adenosylhomocysteine nucleosidase